MADVTPLTYAEVCILRNAAQCGRWTWRELLDSYRADVPRLVDRIEVDRAENARLTAELAACREARMDRLTARRMKAFRQKRR